MTVTEILTNNILPFWMSRMEAPDGGFFGRIDGEGNLCPDAPRGGILNARILWTFASAYRVLGKPEYLETALKARDQILGPFWDSEFGGTYWSLRADGTPEDTKKQIYAIAFAIYGLSELYRATGDQVSLDRAIELFHAIEDHSFDHEKNGYLEAFKRDWSPIEDMRLSDKDQNDAKTMNTHLHVLEGYTSLYRVWKDETLGRQLRNMIQIFLDHICLPSGHLALFFDEDWHNTSHAFSYGHDIEASWLLAEAAEVLGDPVLMAEVDKVCSGIATASMEGWSAEGGMVYEKELLPDGAVEGAFGLASGGASGVASDGALGSVSDGALSGPSGGVTSGALDGSVDGDRHWWVQAETVVGCVWQWRRCGDIQWLDRANAELKFIEENLLCPEGEWYWSLRADGTINKTDDLAGFWKCPYHNGRMCLELLDKLS